MSLESEARETIRRTRVREAVVDGLRFGGLVALTILAPNTLKVLGKAITRSSQASVRSSIYRLQKRGLIVFEAKEGRRYVRLTPAGQRYLEGSLMPRAPVRWDGMWRMVIFDIPEKRKAARHRLRDALSRIGFLRLQHSVWIYPHDCEEIVILLKADYRLGKEVLYVIVNKIENDREIMSYFGL
jgi:DNA-binding transcriptional regulator PaaX